MFRFSRGLAFKLETEWTCFSNSKRNGLVLGKELFICGKESEKQETWMETTQRPLSRSCSCAIFRRKNSQSSRGPQTFSVLHEQQMYLFRVQKPSEIQSMLRTSGYAISKWSCCVFFVCNAKLSQFWNQGHPLRCPRETKKWPLGGALAFNCQPNWASLPFFLTGGGW